MRKGLTVDDHHVGDNRAEGLSDYEAECLRVAYSTLFGQEYALLQSPPGQAEPSWLPDD